jgi:hypothetical protein
MQYLYRNFFNVAKSGNHYYVALIMYNTIEWITCIKSRVNFIYLFIEKVVLNI